MPDPANPILLYDGICGLCNRLVQFVLKHDSAARFRFASLQSGYATRLLQPHAVNPDDLDTVYVIEAPEALPKSRSDAVIFILHKLGGLWAAVGRSSAFSPNPCATGDTTSSPAAATAFSENTKPARSPKRNIKTDFWTRNQSLSFLSPPRAIWRVAPRLRQTVYPLHARSFASSGRRPSQRRKLEMSRPRQDNPRPPL